MNITRVFSLEDLARMRLVGVDQLQVIGEHDRAAVLALPVVREAARRGLKVVFMSTDDLERENVAGERERHGRDERAEAAWKQAHARGPLSLAASPAGARLVAPPSDAKDLLDVAPPVAVSGAMEGLAGEPCAARELSWGDEALPPNVARRVCAWRVSRLIDQGFAAESEAGLAGALRALLHQQLGPLPFHIDERGGFGGPWKYQHVHATIVAPPLGAVPMGIELYARILGAGEYDFAAEAGARFLVRRRGSDDPVPLPGPLWMHVEQATYANIAYPGVGIPLYL